jgi:hypothetical protein
MVVGFQCVAIPMKIIVHPWHTPIMAKKKDENERAFNALQELIARDDERDGVPRQPASPPGKLPYRVKAGRKGGKKGGKARAQKLSPSKLKEIAQKGAKKRWGKD